MSKTLYNFDPLTTFSTFNFESHLGKCKYMLPLFCVTTCISSLLGLLTHSYKGTRRHAIEIMNNLMYLRDACFESMSIGMHKGIRNLISSWLHISDLNCDSSKIHVRVLHPVKIIDRFFNSIFLGDIIYYSTAFIDGVRFTPSSYAQSKVSDDSSIIFKIGSVQSFGRIHRIFTVNDGDPMFHDDVPSKMVDFECATTNNTYTYCQIQTGSFRDEANCIFITATDIVEKCVSFEGTNKLCTFYRFLNLEECS